MDSAQPEPFQTLKGGNYLFLDNFVQSKDVNPISGPSPMMLEVIGQKMRFSPGDIFVAGNNFDSGTISDLSNNKDVRLAYLLDDPAPDPKINIQDLPRMPKAPQINPNRMIFEVKKNASSAEIQELINKAAQQKQSTLHFPGGTYALDQTLTIPGGAEITVIGDSEKTRFTWIGKTKAPMFVVKSPARSTFQELLFDQNYCKNCDSALVIEANDDRDGRVYGDMVWTDNLKVEGLDKIAVRLDNSNSVSTHVVGGGSGNTKGVDILGLGIAGNTTLPKVILENKGRLNFEDVWAAEGTHPFTLTGSGDFTLQSANYLVSTQNPKDFDEVFGGSIKVSNFEGVARFINVMANIPIVFDNSPNLKGLLLGVTHGINEYADPKLVKMVFNQMLKLVLATPSDPNGEEPYDCSKFFSSGGNKNVEMVHLSTGYAGSLTVECKEKPYNQDLVKELLTPVRSVDHKTITSRIQDPLSTDMQLRRLTFSSVGTDLTWPLLWIHKAN